MHGLSFRYGQRHAARTRGRRTDRASRGRRRATSIVDIDLRAFGGSALTADIDVPKDRAGRWRRHPGHLRAGPQHDLPVVRARPGRRCSAPTTSSSASTRSTTAAIPTAGRSTSRPSSAMANLATKAGVEGARAADPRAADAADQGADHPPRARAGRRLRPHPQLLRPRRRRAAPAGTATAACCAGAGSRQAGVADPTAYPPARWSRHELRGQGDLLHAAGRGREHRAPGRLLPVRRLQPVDRARAGPRDARSARFCDTDFVGTDGPGGGKFATAGRARRRRLPSHWPAGANGRSRRLVVCTGGEPLLQLDAELIDALHDARLRDRGRDQRHAPASRRDSTGSASAPRPGPRRCCCAGTS